MKKEEEEFLFLSISGFRFARNLILYVWLQFEKRISVLNIFGFACNLSLYLASIWKGDFCAKYILIYLQFEFALGFSLKRGFLCSICFYLLAIWVCIWLWFEKRISVLKHIRICLRFEFALGFNWKEDFCAQIY